MRILALMTDAFGGYGGIAQYNRDLLHALSIMPANQIETLVRGAQEAPGRLPARVTQRGPISGRFAYSVAAFGAARRFKPDIVISGHLYHGPLAALVAKACGATLVSQLHGTEIWPPARRRDISALRASRRVLCVSRDTSAHLERQLGAAHSGARVVANTVSERFTPGDRKAARARFSVADEVVILTVARLDGRDGYKGHDRIIRALPSLQRPDRQVIHLIAGDGPDRPRLEALAAELGVGDHVRFLGKVPDPDLPDLYRAADLFALPSTGEGFGIVFIEAMGCGTPAIGLAVGGAPDALVPGTLGMCVAEDEFPAALAKALDLPRPDPQKLSAAVHARFSHAAFSKNIHDVFQELA